MRPSSGSLFRLTDWGANGDDCDAGQRCANGELPQMLSRPNVARSLFDGTVTAVALCC
jgi:hypothetical protein